jgi:hypothetical protein
VTAREGPASRTEDSAARLGGFPTFTLHGCSGGSMATGGGGGVVATGREQHVTGAQQGVQQGVQHGVRQLSLSRQNGRRT